MARDRTAIKTSTFEIFKIFSLAFILGDMELTYDGVKALTLASSTIAKHFEDVMSDEEAIYDVWDD